MVFSANYAASSGINNEGNASLDTNPFKYDTQTYSTNEAKNTNGSNFREEEEEDLVGV